MFNLFCKHLTLKGFFIFLKKGVKKFIITSVFLIFIFTGLFFIIPDKYVSSSTIMPISNAPSLGEFASLASLAGINLGNESDVNKIIVILKSRTIRKRVIKKLDLIPVLLGSNPEGTPVKIMNDAIKVLGKIVKIEQDKTLNTITISARTTDPELSRKIVQEYISQLHTIMNEKKLTVARFDRTFLEKKLDEEIKKIELLQKKLADFQKKNRILNPDDELKEILSTYIDLLNKRTQLLMEISTLEITLSPDNPKVRALKKQISFLDKEIKSMENNSKFFPALKKIPDILSEYMDIMRELQTAQEIYEVLLKMYQQARFNEAKEQLFVEVIDPPDFPTEPDYMKKLIILILGFLFAVFVSASIIAIKECKKEESIS